MNRSGRETKKMHQRHRFGTFLAAISLFSASVWSDAEGRVTRQIDKQARAPDLLFAGLLNPFPAVFMAGRDGNVVVLARGNPADRRPLYHTILYDASSLPKLVPAGASLHAVHPGPFEMRILELRKVA